MFILKPCWRPTQLHKQNCQVVAPPSNSDFRPWSTAHHNKIGLASMWGTSSTSLVQFLRGHVKTYFIRSFSVLSLDQPPQSLFSIIFLFLYSWWFGTFIFPDIGNNHPNWPILFRGVGQPPSSLFFSSFFRAFSAVAAMAQPNILAQQIQSCRWGCLGCGAEVVGGWPKWVEL